VFMVETPLKIIGEALLPKPIKIIGNNNILIFIFTILLFLQCLD